MAKRKAGPASAVAASKHESSAAFQDEEPDFPRGGASALTPSEVQEIRAQADAEFENEGKIKRKKQRKADSREDEDRTFIGKIPKSVDLLRFKSLSIGMKLWGVIQEIGTKDMVVSLPGGLRGFVRAKDASDFFNKDEGQGPILLNKLFSERQLVSCVVISLDVSNAKENKKKSKRIGLSLRLGDLHNGLTIDSIHEGLVIQAFVTSIEDHGYLLSFGVPGITGFLRSPNKADILPSLKKGQLVQGFVESIDKKRGTVVLQADPSLVSSHVTKELEGLTLGRLVPGTLVNARVRAVLKNGLLLSFLTYFTGTVNIFHLENPLLQSKWEEHYSENQRLKARILYVDDTTKCIGLTLNTHLVQNKSPNIDTNVGEVFEKAIVRRVDSTIGLLLELPSKEYSIAGYAHISDVSDKHIERLHEKFKDGKTVKGKVIGKRLMDGLAVITLKDSKVKQSLLSCSDIQSGAVVRGEIISVEDFGAFVKLSDGVKALCPLQHMSEFQIAKPSPKFQVGVKMKFKVLTCDVDMKKITLTRKKTMLSSKLKPLLTYEDAVEGLVTHGWISGIEDYGCFIQFYNDVKGLAHRTKLGLEPGVKPESAFQVGQVVRCRVLRVDPTARRLSLSFILSPDSFPGIEAPDNAIQAISIGDVVSGVVAYTSETSITFDVPLTNGVAKAVMKMELLSDSAGHVEQMKSVLQPGCKFESLLVLEHYDQKVLVTSKFSLLSAKAIPSDISQLNPQEIIPGYIASITEGGCFVRFLGGLTGLASVSQLSNHFVHDPNQHFSVGQSVRAQVLEVNLESKRFTVSLKQSQCYSTDVCLLQGYFQEEEKIVKLNKENLDCGAELDWEGIDIGKCIEGEIQDIKEYGVIVNLQGHKDVVGFVTHHQCSPVQVGQIVTARILDIVKSDGIVDLSLRADLVESETLAKTPTKKTVRKRALEIQQKTLAVIELIKDEYLVLSLPDHGNVIGFASAHDFNVRVNPHEKYTLHQRVEVTVGALPETFGVGRLLLLLTTFSDPISSLASKRMKRDPQNVDRSLVNVEVTSIQPLEMQVKLGRNLIGKVHVTQVTDKFAEDNPLKLYTIGQTITAKVLRKFRPTDDENATRYIDLTLRPSQIGSSENIEEADNYFPLPTLDSLQVGQIVISYVKEVHDEWAWLLLSPNIMGRLFVLDSSNEPVELAHFKERYQIGQPVKCRVMKIDCETGKLDLSVRALNTTTNLADIKVNDILGGRVSKILPGIGGLSVQLGAHLFGRVHVTDLLDIWKDYPTNDFQEGQFVKCVVIDVNKNVTGNMQIDISLRDSLTGLQNDRKPKANKNSRPWNISIQSVGDLKVGKEVQGYVKSVTNKGCFVTLSRHVDARILLSNLADTFIADPEGSFPVGKLVTGRIVSTEPLSGFVEMSLRTSSKASSEDKVTQKFSNFQIGDVVSGAIKRIEDYGLFIRLINSDVVGLCHISEISENFIENLGDHFEVNARVQVKILKVNEEKKQISLGMKESYFKTSQPNEKNNKKETEDFGLESQEAVEELSSSQLSSKEADDTSDDDNGDDSSVLSLPPMPQAPQANYFVSPLEIVLGIDEPSGDTQPELKPTEDSVAMVEELDKPSKREKKKMKETREAAIRAAEQRRLEGNEAPESIEDFEKLVHGSPNSSFIWIKYMAFLLSLGDVDKARSIAERSLQTINFREEGEKMNVWVALLNLENVYGTPPKEAVMGVFQKALQYCDAKKLYLALFGIFERSEQHEMADELLKTMTKKFKTSSKIWLRKIQYLLKQGLGDAAHKTLDRALLSLANRKHIKLISQAAISEFKVGSPEHGRNLFEGVLRNYPKRSDLWSVYLDQEIALGEVMVIRSLFERATSLELPPKKMKSLFKKYLEYEKTHGNEERINYVKEKAMQFVESRI